LELRRGFVELLRVVRGLRLAELTLLLVGGGGALARAGFVRVTAFA